MSAQLQQSHLPVAAAQPRRLVTPALAPPRPSRPATAAAGETGFSGSHAERDVGLGLLFRFLVASFLVVGVVVLVNAVGEDWILVPAMAIHLALTYVVLHGIFLLVKDGYESDVPDAQ
jgi:hypothetical protein